ncbi:zinc finger and BTB domain-containing protein 21 [Oncorhynchus kisutch]|uniref:Zinc finger and BTB domain containing 21 n=1 Tax=Oncorhynchus kisutch TaxID=8019 RepID=A0A8C7ITM3_ONCKI|nr:zinc finger and BTB domain-containing protein 21 [Oncorhynchus kisutch]
MTSNSRWMESRLPHTQHNSDIKSLVCCVETERIHRVRMESLVHYSNPSHGLSVLGMLNEQRLKGQLCDTVLVVGDQRYQAHRSVLAASSEYFQSLFTRRLSDTHKVIQLDFCEPEAFEVVLNYIYSSSLFVDRGSLAAIQEMGYSLGIPFLTNIMSTRPHVSYCVSRKRLSFSEEDDNDSQPRSVIMRQNRGGDSPGPSRYSSNYQGEPSEQRNPNESSRNTASNPRKSAEATSEGSDSKSISSYASILKGKTSSRTGSSVRPQLTSSVSFSESPTVMLQTESDLSTKEEEEEQRLYRPKSNVQGSAGEPSQTIDRSGPLIKSLLRRSLSMDSPVPVFSPTLELNKLQGREQSVVKMVAKTEEGTQIEHKHSVKVVPPLLLRSRHHSRYDDEEETQGEVFHVKTEPSSPLSDPSEIIRITVGDSLPVNLKDIEINFDQGPTKPCYNLPGKRKVRRDNRRYPFKKSKGVNKDDLPREDENNMSESVPHKSNMDDNDGDWTDEPRQSKMFKCWNCLKVFRSKAGLHRHVNMYHNPDKPYACDICHKRFHTNFKVWTHCQTQHGVVQNPASSSSSFQLDEKFQRKLIDIVREREIKKALLMKLRRNKQGSQSQVFAKKGGLRSRSNLICPYCGKTFLFLSQFKQHLKTHPAERDNQETESESSLCQKDQDQPGQRENTDTEVYSCRLCNEKLSSHFEQGDHERGCRHATVCPYCGLRFSSPAVKKEHEAHCKYKKLTCLECMRTFKSSFSIWRHQVEVHNHNIMTVKEQLSHQEEINGEVSDHLGRPLHTQESVGAGSFREDIIYSDSSGPPMFDSEDSSSFVPEDLSVSQHKNDHHGELTVKEEPIEEAVSEREDMTSGASIEPEEPGVWPCEKCGKLFGGHKDLERHQELLCHIKPFICHICNKAFRTNFRLWSHFQSHMSTSDEPGVREVDDRRPSSPSPSPPLAVTQATGRPAPQVSPPKPMEAEPVVAKSVVTKSVVTKEEEPVSLSSMPRTKRPEMDRSYSSPLPKTDSVDNPLTPQESETFFYHAPTLSALTFKRQYMCKLCHRTFKTAFSLWSHEQSHSHI